MKGQVKQLVTIQKISVGIVELENFNGVGSTFRRPRNRGLGGFLVVVTLYGLCFMFLCAHFGVGPFLSLIMLGFVPLFVLLQGKPN